MLNFNDWSKKDKKTREKGYTLTKSGTGLPLFVLDDPLQKDDEPILLDDERAAVGKTYKNKGNESAIKKGHLIVNGKIKNKIVNQWLDFIEKFPEAQLYCARGGQRSEIAQLWLKEAGCDIKRISGGFKALRNTCLSILDQASNDDKKWIIISGRTGSAKTKLINLIKIKLLLD